MTWMRCSAGCPLRLLWVLCSGLLGAVPPALAQVQAPAPETITWAVIDWPPHYILNQGRAPASVQALGQGTVERVLAEVLRYMPEQQHRFVLSNSQRMWATMGRGEPLCYPSAFKTPEREQVAVFTPLLLGPPLSLVVRAERVGDFAPQAGAVSLVQLLQRPRLHGRLEMSRSYGPVLDPLLQAAAPPLARDAVSTFGSNLRPLSAGRFDYTLEYPSVVAYAQAHQQLVQPLEVLPLRENTEWVTAYVACTRGAWGERMIGQIDRAIAKAAATPAFREALLTWVPASLQPAGRKRIQAFYAQRRSAP